MRSLLLVALILLVPLTGHAQRGPTQRGEDKRVAMEQLRDALAVAPSEEVAGMIEGRLRRMEMEGGTPAVTLLMGRGLRDMAAKSYDDAIEVFTDAIVLDPTLPEAYHQRAIAKFRAGDTMGAVVDIEETLRREPRAFAAWRTLVDIASAREDWKSAYTACQKLLEINPKMPGGQERLKELRRQAFGRDA